MKKTCYILIILLIDLGFVLAQDKEHRFESQIREFEQEDAVNGYNPDAVFFTGSSSIRMWKTLAEDMSPIPVINRGFGGSVIPDVLYFGDRYLLPHKPEIIVLYSGDNDLANDHTKARDVLQSFKDLDAYLKEHLPDTRLFFISIKPSISREKYWPKMKKANKLLRKYMKKDPRLTFMDIASPVIDDAGKIRDDIFLEDNLHLNEKGYAIWTSIVKPYLMEVYK
jgi:lysophospholipase L1-like esterase